MIRNNPRLKFREGQSGVISFFLTENLFNHIIKKVKIMHRVEIIQKEKNRIVCAGTGEKLSSVLMKNGFSAEHPCGGNGICRKCTVSVNGENQLSCRYVIESDITVTLPDETEIMSVTGASETAKTTENMCFAFDIGTTTLALALVSLDEKKVVSVKTGANPQRMFGADVMSRIDYCRKNGVKDLHKSVITALNQMTDELSVSVEKLYVSGNTTMLHLFFGIDCSAMGVSPYTPEFLESRRVNADDLSVKNVQEIISLPNISAFVGADITAGLNFVGFPQKDKYNILVDLGTNAEIALYSEKELICTAAAAGPCFEGTNISCGMSASDGAIYAYSSEKTEVIGNVNAKGICATGLVDIIAEFLKNEVIDETGYMNHENVCIAENVFVNQNDIRQFQLAKSAVYSAIITLMNIQGISFYDIDKVYIAGGFSSKLNIANAVAVGLLPIELQSKYVTFNNSSLSGTVRFACEKNDLSFFINNAEYIDLASNSMFSKLFIENMMFSFYE